MLFILFLILLIVNTVELDKIVELNNKEIGNNEVTESTTKTLINNTQDYLSYNLKSNNSDLQTIEILSLNYNETYEDLLSKISNSCISTKEYKELHGNRTKAGLVGFLLPFLVDDATFKIGLNELRKGFHLKPQKKNSVMEEFEDENREDTNGALFCLATLVRMGKMFSFGKLFFWPEDAELVENFIFKKFPEVSQLFKLKYEEKGINTKPFNQKTVEELFEEFTKFRLIVNKAINNSIVKSINPKNETANCPESKNTAMNLFEMNK
uniref:Uncharacterized protein n=1 Tax=Meloidogyne hapla TaxID=6305 RepID=A0A1I8BJZ3_MELHA